MPDDPGPVPNDPQMFEEWYERFDRAKRAILVERVHRHTRLGHHNAEDAVAVTLRRLWLHRGRDGQGQAINDAFGWCYWVACREVGHLPRREVPVPNEAFEQGSPEVGEEILAALGHKAEVSEAEDEAVIERLVAGEEYDLQLLLASLRRHRGELIASVRRVEAINAVVYQRGIVKVAEDLLCGTFDAADNPKTLLNGCLQRRLAAYVDSPDITPKNRKTRRSEAKRDLRSLFLLIKRYATTDNETMNDDPGKPGEVQRS